MYKNRLQELCQQRQWPLPEYTATRDGPDHNPRFAATVTVDGRTFDAPDLSRSFKEAHNKAARAAIDALAPVPVPPPPAPAPLEGQLSYKSQLQNISMKRNLIPTYRCVREGPPHSLRFKATVEVDGRTFESQEFFKTVRDAEHDAARIALLALPPEESQQDEPGFYKNLLQQLAQKEGLSLPVYRTVRDGESHIPVFSSSVEVKGEIFHGDAAKTKKQAEVNAAKVAWCQLKECRSKVAAKPTGSNHVLNNQPVPARSPSTVTGPKQRIAPSGQMMWVKKTPEKEDSSSVSMTSTDKERLCSAIANITIVDDQKAGSSGETGDRVSSSTVQSTSSSKFSEVLANRERGVGCTATTKIVDDQEADSSGETVVDHVSSSTILSPSPPKTVPQVLANREDSVDSTSSEDGLSSTSAESSSCSLNCNRVRVYPRKPDMVLPPGVTLLPFSDDKWVAVSLDCSKQSGDVLV